jgi:Mn2+/Fe2+ NRAMP family transporter
LLSVLGPGLITGASDDDPSGIATYSQAGAQFGFTVSWTMLFSYPLMVAIQQISARIARTMGKGIAPVSLAGVDQREAALPLWSC